MVRIGIHELRVHTARVLARVEAGEKVIITRRGKDVAMLIPASEESGKLSVAEAIAGLRRARKGLSLGGLKVRDLINEGRR